ncbi:Glucans biosynthesis glucosyltransferase H [Planctomycetes bacterium Poly30]|uniref:Glucans biosynthesis glucosyltransferase H n=1 Tax=Saltatorellus ferox TaxID=2528018 RepID=A0A518ENY6_9BACT|nr:Glucans biosynthesis glucosyltransferase H [Planctomycetes bacterium Poly30]
MSQALMEKPRTGAALPPAAPLEMPVRSLGTGRSDLSGPPSGKRERASLRERAGRWLTFGGSAALTLYATVEMALAVSSGEVGVGQVLLTLLFSLTFGWIAYSSAGALAGLFFYRRRGVPASGPLLGRTALVMPVYNEDPAGPMAALFAMAKGLERLGLAGRFELFIASDTNRADAWTRETAAVAELREALDDVMPVWYRRRHRNVARKSGNVEDFVKRFGGRYDAMVMLDADSVMSPETLVALSRAMEADPQLGLLQTVPRLAGARGLLPRLQQFASATYGPAISRGVATWQGPDGNYWGHNAIIRLSAFADACGLPELRGRKPFGGPILSHDFAEAAWMRRAGWSVRMDPELDGSYEDGPPTLLDLSQRDRRWMQGNLQHAGIVGARGLSGVSRAHLLGGIAGYLMSPLWLALMVVGAIVAVQASFAEPVYFTEPFQLTPTWPKFDSERMFALFWLSIGVLLLPKAIGLMSAAIAEGRRGGSIPRLLFGAFIELFASALYAPVCMAMQTRQVLEVLMGRDSGWNVQTREGASTPWSVCLQRHALQTLIGVMAAILTFHFLFELLGWVAPTLAGLIVAVPISRWSGSLRAGTWLRERGLLMTPEERDPPAILLERNAAIPRFARACCVPGGLRSLVALSEARARHLELAGAPFRPERGTPDLATLAARAKVHDARTLEELESWLTEPERLALLGDAELLKMAANLPVRTSPGKPRPTIEPRISNRLQRATKGQTSN